jgi:hypothetical protein
VPETTAQLIAQGKTVAYVSRVIESTASMHYRWKPWKVITFA